MCCILSSVWVECVYASMDEWLCICMYESGCVVHVHVHACVRENQNINNHTCTCTCMLQCLSSKKSRLEFKRHGFESQLDLNFSLNFHAHVQYMCVKLR